MKKLSFTGFVLIAGLLAASCSMEERIPEDNEDIVENKDAGLYEEGLACVKVSEELAAALEAGADAGGKVRAVGVRSTDDALSRIGVSYMERVFPPAGKFEERTRRAGLHLWYYVYFDASIPVTRAGSRLSGVEGMEYVEYRPKVERVAFETVPAQTVAAMMAPERRSSGIEGIFDDPGAAEQWHYYNGISDPDRNVLEGCDINVLPAWKGGNVGSDEVIVAVIDGGVDADHEDLSGNMWINEAEKNGIPDFDDDGNGYVDDIYGHDFVKDSVAVSPDSHGTHVAGTIGAVNNNGKGVCGIAGGNHAEGIKGVKIMSAQIFLENITGKAAEAIKYAADNGAVICQNSWQYPADLSMYPKVDRDAIDYFVNYAGCDENGNQNGPMKGGVVVFAAGNDSRTNSYPGRYPEVVAVSALAADYKLADYSNYGPWVDLSAPGGDISKNQYVYSTDIDGTYSYMRGTSMACPHVSGVFALVVSKYRGEGFTCEKARELVERSTTAIDRYNPLYKEDMGSGLVNATDALGESSTQAPERITDLTAEASGQAITIAFTVPEDADSKRLYEYNIYFSSEEFSRELDVDNVPEGIKVYTISAGNKTAGERFEYVLEDEDIVESSIYYLSVNAFDKDGNRSGMSEVVKVVTEGNHAPYFEPADDIHVTLGLEERKSVKVRAIDPDGDFVTLFFKTTDESGVISYSNNYDGSYNIDLDASKCGDQREFQAVFVAQDVIGASATLKIYVTVEDFYVPGRIEDFSGTPEGLAIRIGFTVPEDRDDAHPEKYRFFFSREYFSGKTDFAQLPEGVEEIVVENGAVISGERFEYLLKREDIDFGNDYYLAAIALDKEGHQSEISEVICVEIGENHAPYFLPEERISEVFRPDGKKEIELKVIEPDGHRYRLSMESDGDAISYEECPGDRVKVILDASKGVQGHQYDAELIVTDEYGMAASLHIDLTILENHAPEVKHPVQDLYFEAVAMTKSVDLSEVFADADGDGLTYDVEVEMDGIVSGEMSADHAGELLLTSKSSGMAVVRVKAVDPFGAYSEIVFKVTVAGDLASKGLEIYPNPVSDYAYIRTAVEVKGGDLRVYNAMGAEVFRDQQAHVSVYAPYRIDMTGLGSGIYTVKISFGGEILTDRIVKL